ncbi:MAG TPA: metal ABC transporter permease [Mycobacteriales bacterium]|nr:metal ABC transporter permease [Mycobacteriales bacterium]
MNALLVEPFREPFMERALIELLILGVLSGVVSAFVLIRHLAFVSDALTHTVFPGIVIGYVMGSAGGVFWGALVAGVLTAVLLTALTRTPWVTDDSALAIVLTALFSVGVVLVSRRSSFTSDLDQFLFGQVLTVDRAQIVQTGIVAGVVLLTLAAFGKEFVLRAFDPQHAAAAGYRTGLLDLALNVLIALVVVAAARAVGTVLAIALLIVPAAVGRVISGRLSLIVCIGAVVSVLGGYLGLAVSYYASVTADVPLASGPAVVLVLVAFYLVLFAMAAAWPRVSVLIGRTGR